MPRPVTAIVCVLGCSLFAPLLTPPALAQGAGPASRGRVPSRPVPNPIVPEAGFTRAVAAGTRTTTGVPGPSYWQQHARYTIAVRLDVEGKRLEGTTRIVYLNNSPVALRTLNVTLLQNYHRDDAPKLVVSETTGGYAFTRVAAGGQPLRPVEASVNGPGQYLVAGTNLIVTPPAPLASHDSAVLDLAWSFRIPQRGIVSRMGWNGDDSFYLGYFYPQLAVYDDVVGWQRDPFLGVAEFYAGFADYDVTLDVPAGWLVRGTGRLLNEREVLTDEVLRRLRLAESSDTVVHVLTEQDFGPGRATAQSPDGRLRWHFAADTVRDVAYSVTRASLWDAARAAVGDRDGDGGTDYTLAEAVYRPRFEHWRQAARYAQHALSFHSRHLGTPYPYPRGIAVEGNGILRGGMEFPMITLIGDNPTPSAAAADTDLYRTVNHELAHNWMPMLVDSDERRFAWMDEGTTRYNDRQAMTDFYPGYVDRSTPRDRYIAAARTGNEGPLTRWSYLLDNPGQYGIQGYEKPAAVLAALRQLLGAEAFARAYQGYVRTWAGRHPKPWDFFNWFDASTGQDLGWFWSSWFAETWTLDQAVAAVTPGPRGTEILIRDRGDVPMPARLTVTLANGDTLRREVPVATWLAGARTATVTIPRGREVTRVEIDAEQAFPDVARKNNTWTRETDASWRSLPQAVRNDLARVRGNLAWGDLRPDGDPLVGRTAPGGAETRTITLRGGTRYGFLAACDEDCSDIDLDLVDPSGAVVAQDRLPDDTPGFEFTPPATGAYRLVVQMFACRAATCGWGLQVYR